MNGKYNSAISKLYSLESILDKEYSDNQYNNYKNKKDCLTEIDFYPAYDDRVLESYIEDVEDGDNFADYCKYIFNLYEREDCYEN